MKNQECFQKHRADAFVGIDERMVPYDADRIKRGDLRHVGIRIRSSIARPRERRRKKAGITDAGPSAVFCELRFVNGEHDGLVEPVDFVRQAREAPRGAFS